MRRWVFNLVSALSLLLCLLLSALWVRSHFRTDWLFIECDGQIRSTQLAENAVVMQWICCPGLADPATSFRSEPQSTPADQFDRHALGFSYQPRPPRPPKQGQLIRAWTIPLYAPVVLTAIIPAIGVFLRCRRRSPAVSLCPNCRYDLRSSPTCCPECGYIASASASDAAHRNAPRA